MNAKQQQWLLGLIGIGFIAAVGWMLHQEQRKPPDSTVLSDPVRPDPSVNLKAGQAMILRVEE